MKIRLTKLPQRAKLFKIYYPLHGATVVIRADFISFLSFSFHFITAQHQQADDFGRWERMLRVLFVVKSV